MAESNSQSEINLVGSTMTLNANDLLDKCQVCIVYEQNKHNEELSSFKLDMDLDDVANNTASCGLSNQCFIAEDSISQSSGETSRFCRICHLGCESKNKLIKSPCHCQGTMIDVHRECLERWAKVNWHLLFQ